MNDFDAMVQADVDAFLENLGGRTVKVSVDRGGSWSEVQAIVDWQESVADPEEHRQQRSEKASVHVRTADVSAAEALGSYEDVRVEIDGNEYVVMRRVRKDAGFVEYEVGRRTTQEARARRVKVR